MIDLVMNEKEIFSIDHFILIFDNFRYEAMGRYHGTPPEGDDPYQLVTTIAEEIRNLNTREGRDRLILVYKNMLRSLPQSTGNLQVDIHNFQMKERILQAMASVHDSVQRKEYIKGRYKYLAKVLEQCGVPEHLCAKVSEALIKNEDQRYPEYVSQAFYKNMMRPMFRARGWEDRK